MALPIDPEATEVDLTQGQVGTDRDPSALIGTLFDERYEILNILGQGGSGTVYRALQRSLGRTVAIKITWLDGDHRGDEAARFLREASLAGGLQHSNVVTVHDFGRTEDGACYMVMELLEGVSLRALMGGTAMDPGRALHLFDQILAGLGHAHRAGLVHRDMKPGNVQIVRTDEGREQVKILDFGLVQRAREEAEDVRQGVFVGTPHYASPEQVSGLPADARSDLYAVGVMLYRALAGCLPYAGPTPLSIATAHVQKPYPQMSARAPDVQVSPELEALVRRAMDKEAGQRFQDARSLQLALRAWSQRLLGESPRDLDPVDTQSIEMTSDGLLSEFRWSLAWIGMVAVTLLAVAGSWWVGLEDGDEGADIGLSVAADPLVDGLGSDPAIESPVEFSARSTLESALHEVRVVIKSTPAGAEVEFGGEMLGVTPLDRVLKVGSDQTSGRVFVLRLSGHEEYTLTMDLSLASVSESVLLVAKPRRERVARVDTDRRAVRDSTRPEPVASESSDRLNINAAGASELKTLPGIGEVKAAAIVEWRTTNGPFRSSRDLDAVPGIGPVTLEKLESHITYGALAP